MKFMGTLASIKLDYLITLISHIVQLLLTQVSKFCCFCLDQHILFKYPQFYFANDVRSISRNIASLNLPFHDRMNLFNLSLFFQRKGRGYNHQSFFKKKRKEKPYATNQNLLLICQKAIDNYDVVV